jgi:hypothetical protein
LPVLPDRSRAHLRIGAMIPVVVHLLDECAEERAVLELDRCSRGSARTDSLRQKSPPSTADYAMCDNQIAGRNDSGRI